MYIHICMCIYIYRSYRCLHMYRYRYRYMFTYVCLQLYHYVILPIYMYSKLEPLDIFAANPRSRAHRSPSTSRRANHGQSLILPPTSFIQLYREVLPRVPNESQRLAFFAVLDAKFCQMICSRSTILTDTFRPSFWWSTHFYSCRKHHETKWYGNPNNKHRPTITMDHKLIVCMVLWEASSKVCRGWSLQNITQHHAGWCCQAPTKIWNSVGDHHPSHRVSHKPSPSLPEVAGFNHQMNHMYPPIQLPVAPEPRSLPVPCWSGSLKCNPPFCSNFKVR